MGRQAYLAKIAFGRSAFEPTQEPTQSDEFIQLDSSQAEIPARYHEFWGNNYIQLYDERGNPINPRSNEYGKKLRNAQNDVLAAVGVVERRKSPSEGLPGSYAARMEQLEDEDTAGGGLALAVSFAEQLCIWWVGTIRDRIFTFHFDDTLSFANITALEYDISGLSLIHAGLLPRVLLAVCTQAAVYSAFVYRPIERMFLATNASSKSRRILRRSRGVIQFSIRLVIEILFYPLGYHGNLQRIGLIPVRPFLPAWRSFLPFSAASPLLPLSIYYNPTNSASDFLKAALTSPMILWCVEQFYERWVYATISEAVETSITRPDNPDIVSHDADSDHRTSTILGLRRKSPHLVQSAVHWFMTAIGWTEPSQQQIQGFGERESQATVETLVPLEIPISRAHNENTGGRLTPDILLSSSDALNIAERPVTPPTPTRFGHQEEDDPRIRITNRENIVEMEVRLPPRVVSTHTEIADMLASPADAEPVRANHASSSSDKPQHRVSQLSLEPSRMVGAMVKGQIVGLAMMPLKLVILRLTALHYLRGHESSHRVVSALFRPQDLSWSSIGILCSRIALCSALQVTLNLGLWGFQYGAAVQIGQRVFGWGTL